MQFVTNHKRNWTLVPDYTSNILGNCRFFNVDYLLVSFVLVAFIHGKIHSSFWFGFFVAFSALSFGGPFNSSKLLQRSLQLSLWTACCLIFMTFYSGNLTSQVISPSRPLRVSRVEELHTFIYYFQIKKGVCSLDTMLRIFPDRSLCWNHFCRYQNFH